MGIYLLFSIRGEKRTQKEKQNYQYLGIKEKLFLITNKFHIFFSTPLKHQKKFTSNIIIPQKKIYNGYQSRMAISIEMGA